MTMYDERTNLGQQVARDIRSFFQERVYDTVIPRNIRLGEAPSHGMPALVYDGKSRGAEAYVALAREFLARGRTPVQTRKHNMAEKRPALGRGLSALIPDMPAAPAAAAQPNARSTSTSICCARTSSSRARECDDEKIEELARSIRANGIIQPIVVRKADGGYEIVAGERRWRASQRAGLLKVPVVVRDIPEERLLAAALIENIQREDLNPIEEAHAYRRLADDFKLTQDQIADAVGKDRSSVANYVRLLRLPREVRENVAAGALSMGHARALLSLPDEAAQLRAGRDVVAKNLSVRETEALVKKAIAPGAGEGRGKEGRPHARRRRQTALCARHARSHRSQR